MRVVFVVIDALPNRWVSAEWTPCLWDVIQNGHHNPHGGRAVLSTATYPNHATFVTGTQPAEHGIFVNRVWDGSEFVSAAKHGPKGDTIFLAADRHDIDARIVVGDHKLIGVMGGEDAYRHWPPGGARPGVALDEFRYATDQSVLDAVDKTAALDGDLAVVHFNDPDTACHLHGPNSPETGTRIKATDRAFGQLVEQLRPGWDDTVLVVVSDHDQEEVMSHGFDLQARLDTSGLPGTVANEGTAAVVFDGPGVESLRQLDEIEGAQQLDNLHTLVWGPPGHVFGPWLDDLHGSHGSPRCASQVAVVGGGHPAASALGLAISESPPAAKSWAPAIAGLLGLSLGSPATQRDR